MSEKFDYVTMITYVLCNIDREVADLRLKTQRERIAKTIPRLSEWDKKRLDKMLESLNEKERFVFTQLCKSVKEKDIAQSLNLTQGRIWQIKHRAFEKLFARAECLRGLVEKEDDHT